MYVVSLHTESTDSVIIIMTGSFYIVLHACPVPCHALIQACIISSGGIEAINSNNGHWKIVQILLLRRFEV